MARHKRIRTSLSYKANVKVKSEINSSAFDRSDSGSCLWKSRTTRKARSRAMSFFSPTTLVLKYSFHIVRRFEGGSDALK